MNNLQGLGGFEFDHVPDSAAFAMHPGPMSGWSTDPTAMNNLNGFWDDMMWDTNLPDMMEPPHFAIATDYEFQSTTQDKGAPLWMSGN